MDTINKRDLIQYLINKNDLKGDLFAALTLEKIIDYANDHAEPTKDKAIYILCDLIPELEYYEACAFAMDDYLTNEGLNAKQNFWSIYKAARSGAKLEGVPG